MNVDFAPLRDDLLHHAIELDDVVQLVVEGFGQLVKSSCDLVKPERRGRRRWGKNPGVQEL